ncbi:MAG: hypothetical protein ACKPKO_19160, partial [Candidatus Fonsibacter sp.]
MAEGMQQHAAFASGRWDLFMLRIMLLGSIRNVLGALGVCCRPNLFTAPSLTVLYQIEDQPGPQVA